uniref:Chromo shadow domain-containing protein n=1 Tax=Glossina palpalis gambiensis TaxID=67801 RepID=A0A1B0BSX8_9MUSC
MRLVDDKKNDRNMFAIVEGVEPLKILGATKDASGQIFFLMKWNDPYGARLVVTQVARWPQLVIKFYENVKKPPSSLFLSNAVNEPQKVCLFCRNLPRQRKKTMSAEKKKKLQ